MNEKKHFNLLLKNNVSIMLLTVDKYVLINQCRLISLINVNAKIPNKYSLETY